MATPVVAGNALLAREYFIRGYYPTGAPVNKHSSLLLVHHIMQSQSAYQCGRD